MFCFLRPWGFPREEEPTFAGVRYLEVQIGRDKQTLEVFVALGVSVVTTFCKRKLVSINLREVRTSRDAKA